MRAIFKREFRSFFTSVTGWVFLAAFFFLFDLYFFVYNLSYGYAYLAYPLSSITVIFLILIPLLTMRILSEDKKWKTDQMLLTAPVPVWRIVAGKYLALTAVFTIAIAGVCFCPLLLSAFGTVPMAECYSAVLGTWLFGLLLLAIGLFFSSLTENLVITALATFGVLFLSFMMPNICNLISSGGNAWTKVLGFLSVTDYLGYFYEGTIDLTGIVYYISGSLFCLFLTCQVIQKPGVHAAQKRIRTGVFRTGLILLALVLTAAANFGIRQLPKQLSRMDVTYNNLYTLSDETRSFVRGIDRDISIYVLSGQSDKDETVDKTLEGYASLNKHIQIEYIDPQVSPQFYKTYTDTEPSQNSLIIVCGQRSKVLDYASLYDTSYTQETTGYDGEGQITSALNYVYSEDLPCVYVIQGHGESALESSFADSLEKMNLEIKEVNLLDIDAIPTDTAGVMILGPTSDFSSDDAKKVIDYLNQGGKALIQVNYTSGKNLENFEDILAAYDIGFRQGVVMEGNTSGYYRYPCYILPQIQASDVTTGLDNYIFVPNTQALYNLGKQSDELEWTELLSTSEEAYIKTDIQDVRTLEKESGDETGTYVLAAKVTQPETGAEVTVLGSSYMFTEQADAMVSGSNLKFFTNLISGFVPENTGAISIPVKSYSLGLLTVNQKTASVCAVLLIFVVPAVLVITGLVIWMRRRHRQD